MASDRAWSEPNTYLKFNILVTRGKGDWLLILWEKRRRKNTNDNISWFQNYIFLFWILAGLMNIGLKVILRQKGHEQEENLIYVEETSALWAEVITIFQYIQEKVLKCLVQESHIYSDSKASLKTYFSASPGMQRCAREIAYN